MNEVAARKHAAHVDQERRRKEAERLDQQFAAVFSTDDGREVLGHLCKRFDVLGRTFIPGERGDVNALRAAVRDGERAAVNYAINRIRRADPKYPIPL